MTEANDRERSVQAEAALLHMEDMARYIDARGDEVTRVMKPIKERKARNHFLAEAEALIRGT